MPTAAGCGHPIGVKRLGDRLKAEPTLAHPSDAFAQFGRPHGEPWSAARRAPRTRLMLPAHDLAQSRDRPPPGDRSCVEVHVGCNEPRAHVLQPVEQGDQLTQRATDRAQSDDHQGREFALRDPLKHTLQRTTADDLKALKASVVIPAGQVRDRGIIHRPYANSLRTAQPFVRAGSLGLLVVAACQRQFLRSPVHDRGAVDQLQLRLPREPALRVDSQTFS
jgi:hypothetical protein